MSILSNISRIDSITSITFRLHIMPIFFANYQIDFDILLETLIFRPRCQFTFDISAESIDISAEIPTFSRTPHNLYLLIFPSFRINNNHRRLSNLSSVSIGREHICGYDAVFFKYLLDRSSPTTCL